MKPKLEIVQKLPAGQTIIGAKQIARAAAEGRMELVVVASNCPEWLISRLSAVGIELKRWPGDRASLGTALGKPFPISVAGFVKNE